MPWEVEYTDQFGEWWERLTERQQDVVIVRVELLIEYGPNLPYPYSSDIRSSRHGGMRELRAQSAGNPCESCTPSTPGERPSSFSGETNATALQRWGIVGKALRERDREAAEA